MPRSPQTHIATARKKQADALFASNQELALELEAADCVCKKFVTALQHARRLEEFDAAAVFCELLEKNQQPFQVSLCAKKKNKTSGRPIKRGKRPTWHGKRLIAPEQPRNGTLTQSPTTRMVCRVTNEATTRTILNRATNKYRLTNPGNSGKRKGHNKPSDKWPSDRYGDGGGRGVGFVFLALFVYLFIFIYLFYYYYYSFIKKTKNPLNRTACVSSTNFS